MQSADQAAPFQIEVIPVPSPALMVEPVQMPPKGYANQLSKGASSTSATSPHTCPGSLNIVGFGKVELVNALYNTPGDKAGIVKVVSDSVQPHMRGRTYFGHACVDGHYQSSYYTALRLLGKRFRYSIDLSGAGCGCNAALYLTSMPQNHEQTNCSDYYCDANKVCGAACTEIDIQEANRHAFYATMHSSDDGEGAGFGYGAWRRDWDPSVYGPGARCIDTRKAFQVEADFPIDEDGQLTGMKVTLTQPGKPCDLSASMYEYTPSNSTRKGLQEMTVALAAGMTPIISYWGEGEDISWMDGKGDGKGPCKEDQATCSESVKFFNFSIRSLAP